MVDWVAILQVVLKAVLKVDLAVVVRLVTESGVERKGMSLSLRGCWWPLS